MPVGCRFKCYHPDSRRKFATSDDKKSSRTIGRADCEKMFSAAKPGIPALIL